MIITQLLMLSLFTMADGPAAPSTKMQRIIVAKDQRSFVYADSKKRFTPWGFNYDHDPKGRLIEDYWEKEWKTVVEDFQEMKQLGANVVRIHLQLGKFMQTAEKPDSDNLRRLTRLIRLAEKTQLYLNLTGLGCYHKQDVPPWYDKLSEQDRWDVQAKFWEAIAKQCTDSPAIFCYDLMNEPVVAGGPKKSTDWLGPGFGGKHFVQFITLEAKGRSRPEVARKWVNQLVAAIRKHDKRGLITVGLVPWSLDRPGLTSGFVPTKIAGKLDFISMHIYPTKGKVDEAIDTLKGFAVGKPIVIEEFFPLRCSMDELEKFVRRSRKYATGWTGFYWGQTPAELRNAKTIGEAVTRQWLEFFQKNAAEIKRSK